MSNAREQWITTHNGRSIKVWRATDGQMAVMAQQLRNMKKGVRDNNVSESFFAVGTMMALLDKLIVNEDDRDYLGDLLLEGDMNVADLLNLLLASDATLEGETDATPQTIVKRTSAPARRR